MQGAYLAEAGMDPVAWVQIDDPVLVLYAVAVAEHIHAERAEHQKKMERG